MKYALDTNTLVYFFRGEGQVATRLLAVPPSEVAVPAVVVYELETGIAKSTHPAKRRAQLDRLLTTLEVLPFGRTEAAAAATLRAQLERAGTPIGPIDTLIAGTALARGATLVSRNVREFGRVPSLRVENWFDD